jgi:hypothetical protein
MVHTADYLLKPCDILNLVLVLFHLSLKLVNSPPKALNELVVVLALQCKYSETQVVANLDCQELARLA